MNTVMKRVPFVLVACLVIGALMSALFGCVPSEEEGVAIDPVTGKPWPSTIKIGHAGPMAFATGELGYDASKMHADEINAGGGIQVAEDIWIPIELVKIDTNEYVDTADAVAAVSRAIMVDKIHFLTGMDRSEAILAVMDTCSDHKILFVPTGGAHPKNAQLVAEDYDRYKYWFRGGCFRSDYLGASMFGGLLAVKDALIEQCGLEEPLKVAIIAEKAMWVDPLIDVCYSRFPAMGLEVAGVWRPSSTAEDVTAELTAAQATGAHIFFPIFTGSASYPYSKTWAKLEIPAASLGCHVEMWKKDFWEVTDGLCEYGATNGLSGPCEMTPATMPYYEKHMEIVGDYPTYGGAHASIAYLKEIIEQTGTLDTDTLIAALEKLEFPGPSGVLAWDENHELKFGEGYVTGACVQWQAGELKVIWPDGKNILEVRYPGTVDYLLPPWVIEYWKAK